LIRHFVKLSGLPQEYENFTEKLLRVEFRIKEFVFKFVVVSVWELSLGLVFSVE